MARQWRGLCPAVDCSRLMMMMKIQLSNVYIRLQNILRYVHRYSSKTAIYYNIANYKCYLQYGDRNGSTEAGN
jgi:hypothetical protein